MHTCGHAGGWADKHAHVRARMHVPCACVHALYMCVHCMYVLLLLRSQTGVHDVLLLLRQLQTCVSVCVYACTHTCAWVYACARSHVGICGCAPTSLLRRRRMNGSRIACSLVTSWCCCWSCTREGDCSPVCMRARACGHALACEYANARVHEYVSTHTSACARVRAFPPDCLRACVSVRPSCIACIACIACLQRLEAPCLSSPFPTPAPRHPPRRYPALRARARACVPR